MNLPNPAAPYVRKIVVLVLVPFLAFLFYAGFGIRQTWRSTEFAERVLQQADFLDQTFRLITQLQRERSFSALYLTGSAPRSQLEQEYLQTQPVLELFLASITNASLSQPLQQQSQQLRQRVSDARNAARARETFPFAYQQYNRLIDVLQDVQESMAQAFQDAETARLFNNILLIEAAREHAGKLRVNFTRLLSAPPEAEDEAMYLLFVTHTAIRELLNVRALSLTRQGQQMLSAKRDSDAWKYVNDLIGHLFRGKIELSALNADPTRFVEAITRVIHDLEEITANENQQVRRIQLEILERSRKQRLQTIILILFVCLFLAYLGYDYITGLMERNDAYTRLQNTLAELSEARKQEISIGWQIQQDLLLGKVPTEIRGGRMACRTIPSLGIDGDFIDFFAHDTNTVDILFGDVMGKGIPAALVGAATKSHFQRAMSRLLLELQQHAWPAPEEIVAHVQQRMAPGLFSVERFVSLHYGQFNFVQRLLKLVNCGHTEVLHFHRANGTHSLYEPQNAPLGIFETETFTSQAISFATGDVFVFYSDGITETRNAVGDFFGKERLVHSVGSIVHDASFSPEIAVAKILSELLAFAGSDQFRDDLTLLVIEVA
ncbi:MAG TPA: SpoIIE family protein phosphatase [Candidatus Ozemobacteraceae bacterium]|nr:SpoIIE family protein phosphatase [Candidatus Ozemobacteraceae bacterium]